MPKRLSKKRNSNTNSNNTLFNTKSIVPLTYNQEKTFTEYINNDKNLVLHGMAGTGKTFCALYLALKDVIDTNNDIHKLYIIRSAVPTRDLGFLPGTLKEKIKQYESPYKSVCAEIFSRGDAYDILKSKDMVEFMSTSFIRGETYDNCVLFIDEMQNLTFHELDSVITRAGENTRLIFSGDFKQSDLARNHDRHGLLDFMKILDNMKEDFSKIQFDIDDVVRSGLVKSYLLAKDKFFT